MMGIFWAFKSESILLLYAASNKLRLEEQIRPWILSVCYYLKCGTQCGENQTTNGFYADSVVSFFFFPKILESRMLSS